MSEYYEYYKIHYQVVNEINEELIPAIPLRVGGPAPYRFDTEFLQLFLDHYKQDPDSGKKLDFISYHQYGRQDDLLIRDRLIGEVANERGQIEDWLRERALPTDIPSFITEHGIFPGGNGTEDPAKDVVTQAAAMAAMDYYYLSSSPHNVPFHWTVRHKTNERKDNLVKNETNKLTPYGNLLFMQSRMKDTRLFAESDAETSGGMGVNAFATGGEQSVAVMIWNYTYTDTDAMNWDMTLNLQHLSSVLADKEIRVKIFVIDDSHSNYMHDAEHANLQKVYEDIVIIQNDEHAVQVALHPNAVFLIELSEVGFEGKSGAEGEAPFEKMASPKPQQTGLLRCDDGEETMYFLPEVMKISSLTVRVDGFIGETIGLEIQASFCKDYWFDVYKGSAHSSRNKTLTVQTNGLSARWVRVIAHGNSNNHGEQIIIKDLQVNTVIEAKVWAVQHTGAPSWNLNKDGDDFAAFGDLEGVGVYIQYELGELQTIRSIEMALRRGDERVTSFEIQIFREAGTGWSTVLSTPSSGITTGLECYEFAPVRTRYVKIIGHGNSRDDQFSVSAVRINSTLG